MTTTLIEREAVGEVGAMAGAYLESVLAVGHLLGELSRQGRPAGERDEIIAALDRATKRRRRTFVALLEVRLGLVESDDRERASTIISEALARGQVARVAAAEAEQLRMREATP